MRIDIKKTIVCAAMAGLLTSWIGCKCLQPVQVSEDGHLVILQEPQSQTVLLHSSVTFSVVAMHVGPPTTNVITYQWRFNGVSIAGATSSSYSIGDVLFSNAGTYDVIVTGTTLTSAPAYLNAFSFSPSGNAGTYAAAIGQFTSGSWSCGGGSFQHAYNPTNSDGTPAFFYGPNASNQKGPFMNTTGSATPTVTIDTFSASNGSCDTGIMFQNNFNPINPPLCCNDDANPSGQPGETDNHQSKCNPITLSTGTSNSRYRLTLLYKNSSGPPPGSGPIIFNWTYN